MPWIVRALTETNDLSDGAVAEACRQVGQLLVDDPAEADLFAVVVANARRELAAFGSAAYEVYLTNDGPIVRPFVSGRAGGEVEKAVADVLAGAVAERERRDALDAAAEG